MEAIFKLDKISKSALIQAENSKSRSDLTHLLKLSISKMEEFFNM